MPSRAVPRMPIGSRPGTISRARPPAISPTAKSESRKTSMRSLLFSGRRGPASPAGHGRADREGGIDLEVVGHRRRVGSRGGGGHEVGALDQLHVAPWLALPGKSALGVAVGKNVADRLDLRIELEGGPGGPALVVAVENGGL